MVPSPDNSPPPGSPPSSPEEDSSGASRNHRPPSLPPGVRLIPMPTPPALWKRFIMMCLRPETWAESARYTLGSTVLVSLAAVVLASLLVTAFFCYRLHTGFMDFARNYDSNYPPLILAGDGTLTAKGQLNHPIRFPLGHPLKGYTVVIDPNATYKPADESSPAVVLVTRDKVGTPSKDGDQTDLMPFRKSPLALFVPKAGEVYEINSATLTAFGNGSGLLLLSALAITLFISRLITNSLWVLLVVFVIWPLIVIAASSGQRGIPTPKYIAYRMATAVTVPLLMLGAAMEAAGYTLADFTGPELAAFGWLTAASALGIWTGILAKSIFNPIRVKK